MSIAGVQDAFIVCLKPTFDLSGPCLCHTRRGLEIVLQAGFELVEKISSALRRQLQCLCDDRVNSVVVSGAHDALH